MGYRSVAIYSMDGAFVGYGIKGDAPKLQTTNIYVEGEEAKLKEQLSSLNQTQDIRAFWPNPKDPEVLALLADESFVPIEYEEREVVDDEHSYYVWQQEPEVDETGMPTGRMVQGSALDEGASVIRYKMGRVPKRPTDVMWRIKRASEVVARRRAGLDN